MGMMLHRHTLPEVEVAKVVEPPKVVKDVKEKPVTKSNKTNK